MAKKYYNNDDLYSNQSSRNKMESSDAGMISEDRSAFANLPQQVIMKEYPKCSYDSYELNDNIKGIDTQIRGDVMGGKRKKGSFPSQY